MKNAYDVLPEAFLEKLPLVVPKELLESVLTSFSKRKPTTLRVNTLKSSIKELTQLFETKNIQYQKLPWYEDAFIIINTPLKELQALDAYAEGKFYVQSLSSMIPPLVLDPKPGEKILDICAAPGSKTTQMAALMENIGELHANDSSHIRIEKLKSNIATQGVAIAHLHKGHAETLWTQFPEYFDRTLVDVPCSMEGRFFTEDTKSYDHWTVRKVKELAEMQKFILRAAISATRVGGTIVYSTCTLSPEENEGVIDWILKKEKDAIQLEQVHVPNMDFASPVLSLGAKTYNPEVAKTARVLPSELYEGFYIAKIRKIKSNIPSILR